MRKEIIGNCQLYLGDCLEVLPTLGKVDAIVTDPPYELSDSGPGASHFGMSLNKFDSEGYKNIVSGFNEREVFAALEKICSPFNMFCFCSNRQITKIMAYHEQKNRITTLLIWHKTNAAPFANGVWRGDIEYCIHARDGGATFQGGAREKKKVSSYPINQDHEHPTAKPLALISKYISICSNPNDIILDPFMGSGTTGISCAKMDRKFIGIEIDQAYFDLACHRIEEIYKQKDLFIPSPELPRIPYE